ncbi:hypothetical protein V8E54_003454 [Elaphomyces granulatus]
MSCYVTIAIVFVVWPVVADEGLVLQFSVFIFELEILLVLLDLVALWRKRCSPPLSYPKRWTSQTAVQYRHAS